LGRDNGNSISLSYDGSIIALGAPNNQRGLVRVYRRENMNSWEQLGQDLYGDRDIYDFGSSVVLSSNGDVLVVTGADSQVNGGNGKVRVYMRNGNFWVRTGPDIVGGNNGGPSGYVGSVSVSSNGSVISVTDFIRNPNVQNRVSVLTYVGGTWVQLGQNIESAIGDFITGQISGTGGVVSVFSRGKQRVKVYWFNENNWLQIGQEITASTASISSSGTTLVTSYQNTLNSVIRVFTWAGRGWIQSVKDFMLPNTFLLQDIKVSSDARVLAIDGYSNGSGSLSTMVYVLVGTDWKQFGQEIRRSGASNLVMTYLSGDGLVLASRFSDTSFFFPEIVNTYKLSYAVGSIQDLN